MCLQANIVANVAPPKMPVGARDFNVVPVIGPMDSNTIKRLLNEQLALGYVFQQTMTVIDKEYLLFRKQ